MIYPQEMDLRNQLVQVNYSVKPDNELRLFYAVKGTNEKQILPIITFHQVLSGKVFTWPNGA